MLGQVVDQVADKTGDIAIAKQGWNVAHKHAGRAEGFEAQSHGRQVIGTRHKACDFLAFEIDDDDMLQIHIDVVTEENEDRMQRAVAGCPKSALSIVEVDE